jgi:HPr kinase/phosphorylase
VRKKTGGMNRGKKHPGQILISGELLQIFGLGALILGDSGIGKSESTLELVARGHKLVSDDVVLVKKTPHGRLVGKSPSLSQNFMEIRGLGIINIKEIFGSRSIRRQAPIDLIIRLKKWHRRREYDRLGLKFPEDVKILEKNVPQLNIPVAPGRNIATLIEVACKVHILRQKGYHASREIIRKLDRALS